MVTGGAGYVGSKLIPKLLQAEFSVIVYDTFWYGKEVFTSLLSNPSLKLVVGDVRDTEKLKEALKGCSDVIHLACISNDPSYDLNPKLGEEVNHSSFKPLVKNSLNSGVERFIYASSSSVYGENEEEKVTEKLSLLLTYLKSESFLTSLSAISLSVGPSPNDGHKLTIGQAPHAGFRA